MTPIGGRPAMAALGATCAFLVTALVAPPGHAWKSLYKWQSRVVGYRVNPTNNDLSNTKALAAIRSGAEAWTKQTKAAFRFRYDGTSSGTTFGYDDKNLVLFRNAYNPSSTTVRGTAYKWMLSGKIVEFDIVFWDKAVHFITGSTSCSGDIYLENTAIHEFGHGLGLEHPSNQAATMWGSSPACSKSRLSLHADDIAGAQALYPCSSASQCNDAYLCTTDKCTSNLCQRTPIAGCCTSAAQCDDGKACTKDSCGGNSCKHTAIAGCCTSAAQCDDGKACTKDSCSSNSCKHTAIAGCGDRPRDGDLPGQDAAASQAADGGAADGQQQGASDDFGPTTRPDAALPTGRDAGSSLRAAPEPRLAVGGCELAAGGEARDAAGLGLLLLLLARQRRSRRR